MKRILLTIFSLRFLLHRLVPDCRMKTNECDRFCPVCTRAILWMIDFCADR